MCWGGQEVGLSGKNRILEICIIRWSRDLMAAILDFSFFIKSVKKTIDGILFFSLDFDEDI